MKSESNHSVVDRVWLSGVKIGQQVSYRIHTGSFRTSVETRGNTAVIRAGRRYLELPSDVFDGQIARETGRGSDGRGRTIVISAPAVTSVA